MRIVIIGDGKVGFTLTEQLYSEDHDITVIDTNAAILDKMKSSLDVSVVVGNGASMSVLKDADVPHADVVIAATSADELNLLACLIAKKMGAKRTIARVRNPEYNDELRNLLKEELGLSMVINPDQIAALEISRLIRYPAAMVVESFARGRVDMIAIKVQSDTLLDGLCLKDTIRDLGTKILVCAVLRGDDVTIPSGDFILEADDTIYVTGAPEEIARFLKKAKHSSLRIRDVMIIGGSFIALYLAKQLAEMNIAVKIVEMRHDKCEALCEALPKAMIIEGDGTDQELLEQEGLDEVGAFVALTNIDEENIIASMCAADRGADKVIAKINRFDYPSIIAKTGINCVVSPKKLTAHQIIKFVRGIDSSVKRGVSDEKGNELRTLHKFLGGKVEALDFLVTRDIHYLNIPLEKVPFKSNVLVGMIVRKGKPFLPNGQSKLMKDDTIIVIAQGQKIKSLRDIFADKT